MTISLELFELWVFVCASMGDPSQNYKIYNYNFYWRK